MLRILGNLEVCVSSWWMCMLCYLLGKLFRYCDSGVFRFICLVLVSCVIVMLVKDLVVEFNGNCVVGVVVMLFLILVRLRVLDSIIWLFLIIVICRLGMCWICMVFCMNWWVCLLVFFYVVVVVVVCNGGRLGRISVVKMSRKWCCWVGMWCFLVISGLMVWMLVVCRGFKVILMIIVCWWMFFGI